MLLFPFSMATGQGGGGGGGGGPFTDAPDGAGVAGDGSSWLASDNATAGLRPAYNFHDLSGDGSTEIGALAGVDDGAATVTLGSFTFPYYSNAPTGPHTAVKVCSHGYFFFGSNPATWVPVNWSPGPAAPPAVNTLPSSDDANYLIAPLMKDYKCNHAYAKEITTAGQKRLIVQWDVWDFYATSAKRDIFQCVLREDGSIYFYYAQILSDVSGVNSSGGHTGVGWDVSPFIYGCQKGDHLAGVFIGGNSPLNNVGLVGQLLAPGLAIRIKPPT